jgi:serine phosphatase RsbU (regulator of sigma subunit)
MLMTSFLGHALDLAQPWEPGQVLAAVNRRVKEELGQRHRPGGADGGFGEDPEHGAADEGMDATCLWIDQLTGEVVFAGAQHSLWVFKGGAEPEEIKGDRVGVGYARTPDDQTWTSRTLRFAPGTTLLGTTDGIVDQIGGPRRIAFGRRKLWHALGEPDPATGLRACLDRAYAAMTAYQGAEPRRDDVSLLAIAL